MGRDMHVHRREEREREREREKLTFLNVGNPGC